jgi:hypothetical protein
MYKIKRILNIILIICLAVQISCFFLPSIIQQLYDDFSGVIFDGYVFYGYENYFYYLNILILFLFLRMIFRKGIFKKYLFIVLAVIHLLLYVLLTLYLMSKPFGNTPLNSNIGVGYILNLVFTFIFLIFLFFRGLCKDEIKNENILDDI